MKKLFSFILSLALVGTLIPFSASAETPTADEYISTTIDITDMSGGRQITASGSAVKNSFEGKTFANVGEKTYLEYLHPYGFNCQGLLMDLSDIRNTTKFKWKDETWSSPKNTLTFNGVDYIMKVQSAVNGGSSLDFSAWNYVSYNVSGSFDAIKILANGISSGNKPLRVVLNYTDGSEIKETATVYSGTTDTISQAPFYEGFAVAGVNCNSGWGGKTPTEIKADSRTQYINVYEVSVDHTRTLQSVVLLGAGVKAEINGGVCTYSMSANINAATNIFALTAVVSKNRMAHDLKARVDSVISGNSSKNINEDTAYYNAVKAIYDEAVSKDLNLSVIFGNYTPTISTIGISGTYGDGNTLSVSKTTSDSFGRPVTLSDVKWYRSATITDDETTWTEIGTGETYTMQASDVGSYIYVTAKPTCDAVSDISDIKTTGDKKASSAFFRIVAPEAKDVYFNVGRGIESTYVGEEISVNYSYLDLNGDVEDGTVFTFLKSSKIDGTYEPVQTSTENKYIVKADDLNSFIKCSVKVKNTAEEGQNAVEETSENVYFVQDDSSSFGTKLYGSYAQDNNVIVLRNEALPTDTKDVSTYEWYTTTDIKTTFPTGWTKSNENTQLFNISSDVFGKYIAVVITPKTEKDGNVTTGDKIVKYFYTAQPPVAYDVKITSDNTDAKNVKSGDTLTGTYKYADPNGDIENGTEVMFEKSTDGITWENLSTGASTYTLTDSDINMYIRFSVVPKSGAGDENKGEKVPSESFVTPFAPEVSDVTVSGTVSVGNTLTAIYKFTDKNGNADVDSEVIWYNVSGGKKVELGKGINYVLTSNDAGKTVMYEITPKTTVEPKIGTTVSSNSVTVSGAYVSGGSIGGGSIGGGSYSGGSSYKGTTTTAPTLDYTQKETELDFYDIADHWAEKSILAMNEKGYMTGYEKKFRPDDFISKAELSAVVCRVLGLKNGFSECFIDVSKDDWFGADVSNLYINSIVSGDNGYFYPTKNITRQEAAKIFCESYKYMKNLRDVSKKDIEGFNDSENISQWAKEYVGVVYGLGLMNGDTNSNFNPTANLTRAEACAIIERFSALK